MSRTLRAGALAGALVIGVVAGGSANLALARSPLGATMAPSQVTQSTSNTTSTDQVTAAIQQVIQQANAEQVKAIATGDASVMADTATADHLTDLQQNNQDMTDNGVTDIQLMKLEWGPITVNGTTAQATSYETWSVTTDDGSTEVSRDTNMYTLVQDSGAWKSSRTSTPTTPRLRAVAPATALALAEVAPRPRRAPRPCRAAPPRHRRACPGSRAPVQVPAPAPAFLFRW